MSEQQKKRWWPWVIVALLALSVLYVASSGPAVALSFKYGWDESMMAKIYEPVGWLAHHTGKIGMYESWAMWWMERLGVDPNTEAEP
jgi:hypothetical protein